MNLPNDTELREDIMRILGANQLEQHKANYDNPKKKLELDLLLELINTHYIPRAEVSKLIPEKKKLETDVPLDAEDADGFCIECGQYV